MKIAKYFAAAAALLMATAPAMAAPNPAASLSIGKSVRAGSVKGHEKLAGGGTFVAIAAAAVLVAVVILIADDNSDDNSDSN